MTAKENAGRTGAKTQSGRSGMVHAHKALDTSCTTSPRRTWGGRRNTADRTSESLNAQQVANIFEGATHAAAIGLPLNRHITIHWEQAGLPDSGASKATGRYLRNASEWIARRGGQTAYVWVRENGLKKGSHVHILIHVPARLSFASAQRRWLSAMTGSPYRPRTVRTRVVGRTSTDPENSPEVYASNLANVLSYLVKGASDEVAEELRLERQQTGGLVIGKRAGTSENIGRSARRNKIGRNIQRRRI